MSLLTWRDILSCAWQHVKENGGSLFAHALLPILASSLVQMISVLFYIAYVLTPVMQSGDISHLELQGGLETIFIILKSIEGVVVFLASVLLMVSGGFSWP